MDEPRIVVAGLDLSGPGNPQHTVLTWFRCHADGIEYEGCICPASDHDIVDELKALTVEDEVILGIDAPLSYNDGGGLRECDRDLRRALGEADLNFIGVMPPTFARMGWLTLRGIMLSRTIELLPEAHRIRVVEVHPGAALGLRGAPVEALKGYKKDHQAPLERLKHWLARAGIRGVPEDFGATSDEVDSASGALAAWRWFRGESVWLARAEPPGRPYDFAC